MLRTSPTSAAEAPSRRKGGLAPCRRDGGFTLIELLVVLTLLALASAMVLPRFASAPGPTARERAAAVAGQLRDARQRAIATARPVAVPLDARLVTARAPDGSTLREILFFPDGSSTGGSIGVETRQRRAVVEVDDLTGAVRLHDG
jgi:general secretion pathway protein H